MTKYEKRYKRMYNGTLIDIKAHTNDDLIDKVANKKKEIDEGMKLTQPSTTVRQWSTTWLETYIESKVSPRSYSDYCTRIKKHVLPTLGAMKLKDVRDIDCQNTINKMHGYSKDQIDKVARDMFKMFKKAKSNRMISDNPADDLERPPAVNGKRRAVTDLERALIHKVAKKYPYMHNAENDYRVLHIAGLWLRTIEYMGLRPEETETLRISDIDFKKGYAYIDGTKTLAAKRWVPVPEELLFEFRALGREDNEYIFLNSFGDPLTQSSRTHLWKQFKNQMNIEMGCPFKYGQPEKPYWTSSDLVPYCLRHTYATDTKDAQIPNDIRKEILGHADSDVTDGYTHRTETSLAAAKQLLKEFWSGALAERMNRMEKALINEKEEHKRQFKNIV